MIRRTWINPEQLPAEMAVTAITVAELSAGPTIPFDAEASRIYGHVCAAVVSAAVVSAGRIADLIVAAIAIAIAESLPGDGRAPYAPCPAEATKADSGIGAPVGRGCARLSRGPVEGPGTRPTTPSEVATHEERRQRPQLVACRALQRDVRQRGLRRREVIACLGQRRRPAARRLDEYGRLLWVRS